jgi:hypothetical protein
MEEHRRSPSWRQRARLGRRAFGDNLHDTARSLVRSAGVRKSESEQDLHFAPAALNARLLRPATC